MNIDLKSLGFTNEELQERVIDRICESLLSSMEYDPDSDREFPVANRFQNEIKKRVEVRINETINALAEKYVLPNVAQYIEELTIQTTNNYGEKKGEPVTFIEYLVSRAKAYMQEQVDSSGRSNAESTTPYWSGKQTRITMLVHKHLADSVETAMKDAMTVATGEVARGIHETARMKLNEIAASLKVKVTT